MADVFCNRLVTELLYFTTKQTVSPVLFDVNGAIDCDEKGTEPARNGAILNSMVHSLGSESSRYYPSPLTSKK